MESTRAARELLRELGALWAPPPRQTVSEWSDANRMLSRQASAEPGRWRTSRAEYQREMMDAANDPKIHTVVIMSSAQIGKTEILNNVLAYHIAHDPAPILVVQPQELMAKAWSVDRFSPMVKETPCLAKLVSEAKSRDSKNTMLHKTFPGGHCTVTGAASGANLASRPIRILLCDEVDRYPPSAGSEGDPVGLATKRTTTFWNRLILLTSTPTVKNASRIEAAYLEGDQRRFFVPCPKCGEFQVLTWANVKIPRGTDGEKLPEFTTYECGGCGEHWDDTTRWKAVSQGHWERTNDDGTPGVASFHLSELYSPWVELKDMAQRWIDATGSVERLRVFINTSLGETWEIEGDSVDEVALYERREDYGPVVPLEACVLTAGVDVQVDRLEFETVAWSPTQQSWSMDYQIIYGDTSTDQPWKELAAVLQRPWEHESGAKLQIRGVAVDSGFQTQRVYQFVKGQSGRGWFAIKGVGKEGSPLVGSVTRGNRLRVPVYTVGTHDGKNTLFGRLTQTDRESHGYMHLPSDRDEEWFRQLTSEKRITKYKNGFPHQQWVKTRSRNEAFDCRIYAMAALVIINPPMEQFARELRTLHIPKDTLRAPELGGVKATKYVREEKGHMW